MRCTSQFCYPVVLLLLIITVQFNNVNGHPNHSPLEKPHMETTSPPAPSYTRKFGKVFVWHALSATLAWALILPGGHLRTLFLKPSSASGSFQTHRAAMIIVLILTVQAYFVGVIAAKTVKRQHAILGTILLFLSIIQAIAGVLRPPQDPQCPRRRMWKRFHRTLGSITILFALYLLHHSLSVFEVVGWIRIVVDVCVVLGTCVFIGSKIASMVWIDNQNEDLNYSKVQTDESEQSPFVLSDSNEDIADLEKGYAEDDDDER